MKRTADILQWHPAVSGGYFLLVLVCAMLWRHPACLLISLGCGGWNAVRLTRRGQRSAVWALLIPAVLLTAVINALFNHRGVTRLWYFPSGNALTLESLLYGLGAGLLLAAALLWFYCLSQVFTAEKWMFLFGRALPSLALLLSMSLRFFALYRRRFRAVAEAQGALHAEPNVKKRTVKTAFRSFTVMLSWALESAIVTADSMKSRGYGTARRTAMHRFSFTQRDRVLCFWLLLCGVSMLGAAATGLFAWRYFPTFGGETASPLAVYFLCLYFLTCMTPTLAELQAGLRRKASAARSA